MRARQTATAPSVKEAFGAIGAPLVAPAPAGATVGVPIAPKTQCIPGKPTEKLCCHDNEITGRVSVAPSKVLRRPYVGRRRAKRNRDILPLASSELSGTPAHVDRCGEDRRNPFCRNLGKVSEVTVNSCMFSLQRYLLHFLVGSDWLKCP